MNTVVKKLIMNRLTWAQSVPLNDWVDNRGHGSLLRDKLRFLAHISML